MKFTCPGGEIGRRTVFRSQHSQGCAGSSPVLGTDVIIYNNKLFYLITFFVYAFQFFQRSILLSGYAPDSFKIDSTPENEMRCSKNG